MNADEWNDAWKAQQAERGKPHDVAFWDKRAKSFTDRDTPDSYTDQFLLLAEIHPGETVFDMGCGTGNLSIPLGEQGHNVLAADFSPIMLERLGDALKEHEVSSVRPLLLSWEDQWEKCGIEHQSYDVCIASRSIATPDLGTALSKITAVARRRVCITLATGISPRIDEKMLRDIDIDVTPAGDFVYAIAILSARGYTPELTYIQTQRSDIFATFDEAFDKYASMVTSVLRENTAKRRDALKRLIAWLESNLVEQQGHLTLAHPREVPWAFISWNVNRP